MSKDKTIRLKTDQNRAQGWQQSKTKQSMPQHRHLSKIQQRISDHTTEICTTKRSAQHRYLSVINKKDQIITADICLNKKKKRSDHTGLKSVHN